MAQQPTLDRAASRRLVDGLKLSNGTLLYDGLRQAVALGGKQGQRSVIVLSDGRDTSTHQALGGDRRRSSAPTPRSTWSRWPSPHGTKALLSPLSTAGHGAVISANDPRALGRVFAERGRSLAQQIQITAKTPAGAGEGTLSVSVSSGDQTYTDDAYVTLSAAPAAAPPAAPHQAGARTDGLRPLPPADARRPRGPRGRAAGRDGRPVRRVRPAEGVAGEPDRGLHPAGPRQARSFRSPAAAGRDRAGGGHGQPGAAEQPRASRPSSATGSRPRASPSSPPSGCSSTPASRSAPPRSSSPSPAATC